MHLHLQSNLRSPCRNREGKQATLPDFSENVFYWSNTAVQGTFEYASQQLKGLQQSNALRKTRKVIDYYGEETPLIPKYARLH